MKIEQIKIAGLFAKYDANLTVRDNTIILVGANGLGKSTILNIVHYTLTKQWDLLPTLPFRSVTIEINGRELTLHADYLRSSSIFSANQEDLQSRSPQRFRANLHSLLSYSPELLEALLKIDDSDQFVQTFRGLSRTLNIEDLYETWSFLAVPQNKRIVESLIEPGPISRYR